MSMHESWNKERGHACGGQYSSSASSPNEAKGGVCACWESQRMNSRAGDTDKLDCLISQYTATSALRSESHPYSESDTHIPGGVTFGRVRILRPLKP